MLATASRLTLVILPAVPRTPMAILSDMDRLIQAQSDRIARKDTAWSRAKPHQRRVEAGHRCLVVDRASGPAVVPLADLTEAEMEAVG